MSIKQILAERSENEEPVKDQELSWSAVRAAMNAATKYDVYFGNRANEIFSEVNTLDEAEHAFTEALNHADEITKLALVRSRTELRKQMGVSQEVGYRA